jgi:acetyl esterase/lipase
MYRLSLACFLAICTMSAIAQKIVPLYPGTVPGSKPGEVQEIRNVNEKGQVRYERVTVPTLEVWMPEKNKATGAAVIIVPGGGYRLVSYTNEGTDIAAEFARMGVTAFILKYRLPSDNTMSDNTTGPLQDAQMAIHTVRSRATEWGIDPKRVGIIGFSAGGHLASTAGTHLDQVVISNPGNISLRPDFMVLVYPVISFTAELMHKGSRDNLLGAQPDIETARRYSNELQVTPNTPPTLLIHSADDKTVPVGNSIRFYEALLKNGVSAEMHLYPKGGHGFGIGPDRAPDHWTDRVQHWLKALNIIPDK